ncbi:hypothetical protein WCP94_000796 (plasmid) [Bilophila wadsworthia]
MGEGIHAKSRQTLVSVEAHTKALLMGLQYENASPGYTLNTFRRCG